MSCQWNDEENNALLGLPFLARVVYLQGIRRHMDYATGITGLKRGISYQSLSEVAFVEHHQGRKESGEASRKTIRVACGQLEKAGLIEPIRADRQLIFRCLLATLDESGQNKQGRRRADVGHTLKGQTETDSSPNKNNNIENKQGRVYPQPEIAKQGTPPLSVIRIKKDSSLSALIFDIFTYWQNAMSKQRCKLDAKRTRAITARLKDGYSAEEIKQAIDGCRASAWHMGENERRRPYNDIELICRDATKLDSFREQITKRHAGPYQQNPPQRPKQPDIDPDKTRRTYTAGLQSIKTLIGIREMNLESQSDIPMRSKTP